MKTLYNITFKVLLTVSIVLGISTINSVVASHSPSNSLMNEIVLEENLSVENWMVNLDDWNLLDLNENDSKLFEAEVSIEKWMLSADESNWHTVVQVESENEIEIESWMTDLSKW